MANNISLGEQITNINKDIEALDNVEILRYMDLSKFMDLLENERLFFCNANYFEDKYEGVMPKGGYAKVSDKNMARTQELSDKQAECFPAYINSWNYAKEESYALWRIYTDPKAGIAIKTTVGNLKKSLNNEDIKIYNVQYIKSFDDTSKNYEPPFYYRQKQQGNSLYRRVREIYKLNSYKYEDEIRAVYIDPIKELGIYFDVDLNSLINKIYISPFAPKWFVELVKSIIKKYNISDKIVSNSEILLRY